MAMDKPDSVVRIPTTLDTFFKTWLIFLRPYHELTDRQIDVTACFLKHRYQFSKVIKDDKLLNENVLSENTKRKVREECGISNAHFQGIMGVLKRRRIIVNGIINHRYIPNLKEDPNSFSLLLYFQIQ